MMMPGCGLLFVMDVVVSSTMSQTPRTPVGCADWPKVAPTKHSSKQRILVIDRGPRLKSSPGSETGKEIFERPNLRHIDSCRVREVAPVRADASPLQSSARTGVKPNCGLLASPNIDSPG